MKTILMALLLSSGNSQATETSEQLWIAQVNEARRQAMEGVLAPHPELADIEAATRGRIERILRSGHMAGRKQREFESARNDFYLGLYGLVDGFTDGRLQTPELDQLTQEDLRHPMFRSLHEAGALVERTETGWARESALDYSMKEARAAAAWMDENRATLQRYAGSPLRGRLGRTAPDVEKAIGKLRLRGVPVRALAEFDFAMPDGVPAYLVTPEQAAQALRLAYGAETLERLPGTISGFEKPRLFELMKEMVGPEGLGAFSYHAAVKGDPWRTDAEYPDGPEYYSLPAVEAWASQHRVELGRILNDRWIPMPVHPAMIWAVQEVALRRHVPVQDIVVATPEHLYVRPDLFPVTMEYYRANQSAMAGEKVADALDRFRAQVSGELTGLKEAVERLGSSLDRTDETVAAVAGESAGMRRGVWTLDLLAFLALVR